MRTILVIAAHVALSACGGGSGGSTDIAATLHFAERTDLEITRLVGAAMGNEMFQAQAAVLSFDSFDGGSCPTEIISGNTVTLTGGCSIVDGPMVSGSAQITNPPSWGDDLIEYDYDDDQVYVFHQLALDYGGFITSYDGTLRIGSQYTVYDSDVTVEQQGAQVRSDLYFDCEIGGCDIGNSGLELVGVGGAQVSGSIRVGSSIGGELTLRGADTVDVELASGCVHWSLRGTDRGNSPCP